MKGTKIMETKTPHQLYNFENATQMYNSLKKVLKRVAKNMKEDYEYIVALNFVDEYCRKKNVQITSNHKMEIAQQLFQTTGWEFFDEEENKMISSHNKKRK